MSYLLKKKLELKQKYKTSYISMVCTLASLLFYNFELFYDTNFNMRDRV